MKRLRWFISNFEELIAGTGLVITVLAIAFNVIMRYFFSRSQNWAEEIASMGFSWVVFVGAAAVYKRNMHIGIDAFINLLPARLRDLVGMGMTFFLLALNIYLTYLSLVFSVAAWAKPTHILLIPYTFIDISSSVGFACMTGHAAVDFVEKIKGRGVAEKAGG